MTEEGEVVIRKGSIWSGTVTIGLVNVPVKLYTMIFDKGISFHFLHKQDGQPLKYQRVCLRDDKVIPWEDTTKGYEVRKGEFIIIEKGTVKLSVDLGSCQLSVDGLRFGSELAICSFPEPLSHKLRLESYRLKLRVL